MLTKKAVDLLSQGRDSRLTEQELLQLTLHIKMIASWADRVPQETTFFFVEWQPILRVPHVEGLSRDELAIAAYLQPLHSQLGAIALQVLWKASQLIQSLCHALNAGDLIVAATMARSLVETTAAFGCESDQIARIWTARTRQPAPDTESLQEFMKSANAVVGQILFGTKLKREKTAETGIERTNILTLIDRAERLSTNPSLHRYYDILCDTVHPSIGSNRCFWSKEPSVRGGPVFEFVTQRASRGELSDLPGVIGKSTLWALTWLGWMWNQFNRMRHDLCLTAKIYALPAKYYSIVHPGQPEEYCPCGSTMRSQLCAHYFGRPEAIVDQVVSQPGNA